MTEDFISYIENIVSLSEATVRAYKTDITQFEHYINAENIDIY